VHEKENQCYKELAVQGFLRWWRDQSMEFPALIDLARNLFWMMATGTSGE